MDPVEVFGRDLLWLLFRALAASDLARAARVSRAWRNVVARFLREGTVEFAFSGSVGALSTCPLTHLRRVVLNVTSAETSEPRGAHVLGCSELVVRTHTPSLLAGNSVTSLVRCCPSLRWLEVDWSDSNIREQLAHAARHTPSFKQIAVIIAGRFTLWNHAPEFYCFRGFHDRRALERVLELQLGALVGRTVELTTQAAVAFYRRLLGARDWSVALTAAGTESGDVDVADAALMVSTIEALTGEGAHCANIPQHGARCFMWFNCHDCRLDGPSGLCFYCATVCHKAHSTVMQYVSSGAYCDCQCTGNKPLPPWLAYAAEAEARAQAEADADSDDDDDDDDDADSDAE